MKINRRIEIVRARNLRYSSLSMESALAMQAVLIRHYSSVLITSVESMAELEQLSARQPDLIILGAHRLYDGGDIWLADYLDEQGLAYTGSQQAAHALESNKPLAKQRVMRSGLKSSLFMEAIDGLLPNTIALPYPLFVKPTGRGGGSGVDEQSVVHDYEELQAKVLTLYNDLGANALIEAYLPGREFSVAIFKREKTAGHDVMPIELVAPKNTKGDRLLSSAVKSANSEVVQEYIDKPTRAAVSELALGVFTALGGRDYGRIDIRLDAEGQPHFLEANLIPSLIEGYGSFPKACSLHLGLDYEHMMLRIVRLGLSRAQNEPYTHFADPSLPSFQPAIELA